MSIFRAVLVEDETHAAKEAAAVLADAGFSVQVYAAQDEAVDGLPSLTQPVDLIVLDRRLPATNGSAPSNSVGDELLGVLLKNYPDSIFVVFSGQTGMPHHQFATAERGVFTLGPHDQIVDRVRVFEKGQSLEFDQYIKRLSSLLSEIEDIEVLPDGAGFSPVEKRLLRRVGTDFGGSSIEARRISGGRSGSPVWLCAISDSFGVVARAVVKAQPSAPAAGGFLSLCPPHLVAGRLLTISGLCCGKTIVVQQLVDGSPVSLFEGIVQSPESSSQALLRLRTGLERMPQGARRSVTFDELTSRYGTWPQLEDRAMEFDIALPPPSRIATTTISAQHGDLHPGNVLLIDGDPLIIDFDSQCVGSRLIDVLGLLLGALLHEDSSLRAAEWPAVEQFEGFLTEDFLRNCPSPQIFSLLFDWVAHETSSKRELHGLILAACLRQLKFEGVRSDSVLRSRSVALAKWAALAFDAD